MDKVEEIIEGVLRREGGYVNDPDDPGGETNYGITVAVARANGWQGPMKDLPIGMARRIYCSRYVLIPRFDDVYKMDSAVGEELIDTGVNMGPATAAAFLQRWLNGFNVGGKLGGDLFVDGRVGKITLDALRAYLAWRRDDGRVALLRGLNGVQGERYLAITEAKPTQRRFLFGWMLNRVEMGG